MKTANCTLEVITTKKKVTMHIFIERISDEIYNMGNSSFVVNLSKTIFSNGKLIFTCKKYSTKGYEAIEFVKYPFGAFGLQIRCNNAGREVSEKKTKIATVAFDRTGDTSSVKWRLRDCGVVTPNKEDVATTYTILNKL